MTDIIFSFDTEDFTSDIALDCIRDEAKLLTEEGVRGCFCVVGLVAKRILEDKRQDVLDALANHEIDFHTYSHSVHPQNDYLTDIEDAELAEVMVKAKEELGLSLLEKTFGKRRIYAAVPPGCEASYVTMYAYSKLGVPIYSGACCDTRDARGVYYCNMYQMEYTTAMEDTFFTADDKELCSLIDWLAEKKHAVFYTHPHISRFAEHWDSVNYVEKNCPFGEWKLAPLRPEKDVLKFFENFRKFIRMIKKDERFRIATYEDIYNKEIAGRERKVSLSDIHGIREKISERLYPVDVPCSLSVSDIFAACRELLLGETEYICGNVRGFLRTPYSVDKTITVSADEITESARSIDVSGYLPEKIEVGGCMLGPADWLRAALAVLDGEKTATLSPAPSMPSLDEIPGTRDCYLKNSWIRRSDFEDEYLSDRLRLQAWTMRF